MKIHKIAQEYKEKGFYILLCGSKTHPENVGTISFCGKNSEIIEECEIGEAYNNFKNSKIKKLLLISQTTYSLEKFYKIEKYLKEKLLQDEDRNVEFVVNNTICRATELRQKETEKLSKTVDCMIIIGGKNSSNTRKLYDIAKNNCEKTICIETVHDIDIQEILKYEKVGIMAGASTPDSSIKEVINELEKYSLLV